MTTSTPRTEKPGLSATLESEPIEQASYTLLVKAASRLEADLNRVLRSMDLTSATFNILRVLQAAGSTGSSCGDISEQLIAEVPDMTRLLDRLERLEYIARERSNVDRRMVRVTITQKGLDVLESLQGTVRDCHVRQLGHLGHAKLAELGALLRVILGAPAGPGRGITSGVLQVNKQPEH